ncbi:MAG TPA: DUF5668 domain-containing protein [Bryobacteraceae bacterium]|nr:DUF5668 domain-containing protein [Bryobacteraceae bacterium]
MSATPTPPTPPPLPGAPVLSPRGVLIRALRGPLLLTALGILLAADRLGSISFGRSWPILLIVFGACKMAEHMEVRQA